MNSLYQIQTPIEHKIKEMAELKAAKIGLNSFNDLIRFLIVNFVENRVAINIDTNNETKVKQRNIIDPFELTSHYRGLSIAQMNNTYIYEATNYSEVSSLIAEIEEFHIFLLNYLGYKKPKQLNFVLLQDRKILSDISQKISGEELLCGIDPQRLTVYIVLFQNQPENLRRMRQELTRLVSVIHKNEKISTLYITEYLAKFFGEYGNIVQLGETLPLEKREIERITKQLASEEYFNTYEESEEKRSRKIHNAKLVYVAIYNYLGQAKFADYIKYMHKNPNIGFKKSFHNKLRTDFKKILKN